MTRKPRSNPSLALPLIRRKVARIRAPAQNIKHSRWTPALMRLARPEKLAAAVIERRTSFHTISRRALTGRAQQPWQPMDLVLPAGAPSAESQPSSAASQQSTSDFLKTLLARQGGQSSPTAPFPPSSLTPGRPIKEAPPAWKPPEPGARVFRKVEEIHVQPARPASPPAAQEPAHAEGRSRPPAPTASLSGRARAEEPAPPPVALPERPVVHRRAWKEEVPQAQPEQSAQPAEQDSQASQASPEAGNTDLLRMPEAEPASEPWLAEESEEAAEAAEPAPESQLVESLPAAPVSPGDISPAADLPAQSTHGAEAGPGPITAAAVPASNRAPQPGFQTPVSPQARPGVPEGVSPSAPAPTLQRQVQAPAGSGNPPAEGQAAAEPPVPQLGQPAPAEDILAGEAAISTAPVPGLPQPAPGLPEQIAAGSAPVQPPAAPSSPVLNGVPPLAPLPFVTSKGSRGILRRKPAPSSPVEPGKPDPAAPLQRSPAPAPAPAPAASGSRPSSPGAQADQPPSPPPADLQLPPEAIHPAGAAVPQPDYPPAYTPQQPGEVPTSEPSASRTGSATAEAPAGLDLPAIASPSEPAAGLAQAIQRAMSEPEPSTPAGAAGAAAGSLPGPGAITQLESPDTSIARLPEIPSGASAPNAGTPPAAEHPAPLPQAGHSLPAEEPGPVIPAVPGGTAGMTANTPEPFRPAGQAPAASAAPSQPDLAAPPVLRRLRAASPTPSPENTPALPDQPARRAAAGEPPVQRQSLPEIPASAPAAPAVPGASTAGSQPTLSASSPEGQIARHVAAPAESQPAPAASSPASWPAQHAAAPAEIHTGPAASTPFPAASLPSPDGTRSAPAEPPFTPDEPNRPVSLPVESLPGSTPGTLSRAIEPSPETVYPAPGLTLPQTPAPAPSAPAADAAMQRADTPGAGTDPVSPNNKNIGSGVDRMFPGDPAERVADAPDVPSGEPGSESLPQAGWAPLAAALHPRPPFLVLRKFQPLAAEEAPAVPAVPGRVPGLILPGPANAPDASSLTPSSAPVISQSIAEKPGGPAPAAAREIRTTPGTVPAKAGIMPRLRRETLVSRVAAPASPAPASSIPAGGMPAQAAGRPSSPFPSAAGPLSRAAAPAPTAAPFSASPGQPPAWLQRRLASDGTADARPVLRRLPGIISREGSEENYVAYPQTGSEDSGENVPASEGSSYYTSDQPVSGRETSPQLPAAAPLAASSGSGGYYTQNNQPPASELSPVPAAPDSLPAYELSPFPYAEEELPLPYDVPQADTPAIVRRVNQKAAESAEKTAAAPNVKELARQVYPMIKRMIALERERTLGGRA